MPGNYDIFCSFFGVKRVKGSLHINNSVCKLSNFLFFNRIFLFQNIDSSLMSVIYLSNLKIYRIDFLLNRFLNILLPDSYIGNLSI